MREGRWTPLLAGALGIAALAGCKRVSASDEREIDRLCTLADESARSREADWQSAMGAAFSGAAEPRPDLGPCPINLGTTLSFDLTFASAEATLSRAGLHDIIAPTGIAVVTPAELPGVKSLTARKIRYEVQNLRARTDGVAQRDGAFLVAEAKKLVDPGFWKWDAVVVVANEVAARDVDASAGTFRSGSTRGRVYVYDYVSRRVACAADFEATNSDKVTVTTPTERGAPADFEGHAKPALDSDLVERTIREAFKKLVAAGPPRAPRRDAGP